MARKKTASNDQESKKTTAADNETAVAGQAAGQQSTEANELTSDAPRLSTAELAVQPIVAEAGESIGANVEVHNFAWAASQVQNGLRVKRDAWIGNKFVEAAGSNRTVLTNEDMLATDWIVV